MQPSSSGSISLSGGYERDVEKSAIKPLPRLRADLQLMSADHSKDGLPSWTLYDTLRGKFFRLGWVEFELLKRWKSGTATAIVDQVNRETTIRADVTHVADLEKMLIENELVDVQSITEISQLLHKKHANKVGVLKRLFTIALFYRKPLINPDRLLQTIDSVIQPLYAYKSVFYTLITLLALFVGFGWSAHAFELKDTFAQFMNPTGILMFGLILVCTNVLHEIGHGVVAKHYGCSVRHMGVALIFMLPVCYCDTTDAWRLKDRRKRLLINAGGMAAEVMLALCAGFLWLVFPEGIFKTLAFFVAVTSLATTLLVNLNPFLKFDGYYLLADSLQIDNLQVKSFSTLRWKLRCWVLGHQDPMPYRVSRAQTRVMCFYAAATWLYRFFLYQVIALMVYEFWFKALGIVMMTGVICSMLIQPVFKELLFYAKSVRELKVNGRILFNATLFIVLLLLILVPLPRKVSAPAVLSASEVTHLYAPTASQVKSIHVKIGDQVSRGQILIELSDHELFQEKESLESDIALLKHKLSRQTDWVASEADNRLTENDLDVKLAAMADVQQSIDQLKLTAAESGYVVSLPIWLTPGLWVAQNDVLAQIAQKQQPEVRTYVNSLHIDRLQGSTASFYTKPHNVKYPLETISVSSQSISVLTDETLAVNYGGVIAANKSANGDLIPVQDWHQLKLSSNEITTINREQQGYVMFSAEPRSIAASVVSRTYGMLIRESGF